LHKKLIFYEVKACGAPGKRDNVGSTKRLSTIKYHLPFAQAFEKIVDSILEEEQMAAHAVPEVDKTPQN
jgi:hypothetical protein